MDKDNGKPKHKTKTTNKIKAVTQTTSTPTGQIAVTQNPPTLGASMTPTPVTPTPLHNRRLVTITQATNQETREPTGPAVGPGRPDGQGHQLKNCTTQNTLTEPLTGPVGPAVLPERQHGQGQQPKNVAKTQPQPAKKPSQRTKPQAQDGHGQQSKKQTTLIWTDGNLQLSEPPDSTAEDQALPDEVTFEDPAMAQRYCELKERWENRSSILRQASGANWQRVQERFLYLLVLTDEAKVEEIMWARDEGGWSYGTTQQYWSGMLKAAEACQVPITPEMRLYAKILTQLKDEEDPKRPTVEMTLAELRAVLELMNASEDPEHHTLALALELAFELGQRMGDTLQLEAALLAYVDDRKASGVEFQALTFRRGKTVKRRKPFTLHLPWQSDLAQRIWHLATTKQGQRLFCLESHRADALETIRMFIQKVNPEEGILSIRRGGLQQLALNGASLETLLHHSRHSDISCLNRYMGWGQTLLHAARERYAVTQRTN